MGSPYRIYTHVVELALEGSVGLEELEEALEALRFVGQDWLGVREAVLSPEKVLPILILILILLPHGLLDAHTLVEVSRLIDVAVQNARVQLSAGVVHCKNNSRES